MSASSTSPKASSKLPTVYESEAVEQPSRVIVGHAIPVSQRSNEAEEDAHQLTCITDLCLDWVVFPSLLFIQFGATMYCQAKVDMLSLDWRSVLATIALFCLVAGVYRSIVRHHPDMNSLVMLLLPEIFTNIVLAIVMFGNVVVAFQTLVGLTVATVVIGTAAGIHGLLCQGANESGVTSTKSSYDYQPLLGGADENC